MRSINKFIHQKRAKAILVLSGYKSKDIARKTGFSKAWISQIINNKFRPRKARELIATAIGRPIEDLWPDEKPVGDLWPDHREKT